jgi:hypothetical protein
MFIRVPPARAKISPDPKEKETTMTIKQPASKAAVPSAAATAAARTPRRRLILLASPVLVLLASVVLAVTALIPSPTPAAHGPNRPLAGTGTGTMTLNLLTGAATADFTGDLSPLGADTGHDDLTLTPTSASTFTYTGTRTFGAANGDKLFSAITGRGRSPAPPPTARKLT